MKKIKLVVIFIVIFLLLRTITILALSGINIFPCQIGNWGSDFVVNYWHSGMCDVNYEYWTGSISILTPVANVARIALIDILPAALTLGIMYIFRSRKKLA